MKCAAIKASLEIMAANLNEFRWGGRRDKILPEMFKQTAQQLAEQKYGELN